MSNVSDVRPPARPPTAPNPIYAVADYEAPANPGMGQRLIRPIALAWYLARRGGGDASASRAVVLLPLIAFASATALALTVIGGVVMFLNWPPDKNSTESLYIFSALFAGTLLVIPLLNLAAAAARLSARRRDERLSTLRLLGATSSTVSAMTVIESSVVAFFGAALGIAVYLLGTPIVGLLSFGGKQIGAASLLLPPVMVILVVCGMTLLAAVSAIVSIRGVIISPLGVRTRTNAPPIKIWVFFVVGAVLIGCVIALQQMLEVDDAGIFIGIFVVTFAIGMLILNLLGPLIIGVLARRQVKRAKTPEKLMAMRLVLESPKSVWRQVGGVAVTSFVAVVVGNAVSLISLLGGLPDSNESDLIIYADMQTGVYLTIFMSFLMVACAVGVSQASAIYDRSDLYQSLSILGLPSQVIGRSRRIAVLAPLRWVMLSSVVIGGVLLFPVVIPLLGMSVVLSPLSFLTVILMLAGGIALVWGGVIATKPLLKAVSGSAD